MIMWGAVGHRNYLKGNFDYFDEEHGRRLGAGNDGGKVVKDISLLTPIPIEIGIILASISMGVLCLQVGAKVVRQMS